MKTTEIEQEVLLLMQFIEREDALTRYKNFILKLRVKELKIAIQTLAIFRLENAHAAIFSKSKPERIDFKLKVKAADAYINLAKELLYVGGGTKDLPTTDLADLGINIRTLNALKRNDITTIDELADLKVSELRRYRNIGHNTILEISVFLNSHGLKLKG